MIQVNGYANIVEPEIDFVTEGVNLSQSFNFKLSSNNSLFDYYLSVNEIDSTCVILGLNLSCSLEEHSLKQGESYSFTIFSRYKGTEIETLYSSELRIKTPVALSKSSIDNKATIVDHTPKFKLNFSKSISEVEGLSIQQLENGKLIDLDSEEYKIETNVSGKQLEITVSEKLQQNTEYLLTIDNIIAEDNSFPEKPIEIVFYTSDGPTVNYTNALTTQFPVYENIVLGFDEILLDSQNLSKLVTVTPNVDFAYYISGSSVTLNPKSSLEACKSYTLTVSTGVESINNVKSEKSFSKVFKTACARVTSIGTSVQGRGIYAYYLGTGAKKIIFFGAMHGTETNSKLLLDYWVDELETNYSSIPSDITVIVVPTINPDGVAKGTRFNANTVDLNRNFNTSDWQEETYFLGGTYESGGGSEPFSEPESKAITNLITSQGPILTLSYHSAAAYVVPNSIASAATYGQKYAQLSGYQYIAPTVDDAFEYGITGSFGQWSAESGRPSLTIELATPYYSESATNFPAMWGMLK